MFKWLALPVIALALMGGIAIADWAGSPASPQPVATHSDFAHWSFATNHPHPDTWYQPNQGTLLAQHGADCSSPPATHAVTTFEDRVYICNNHIMTAMNAGSLFQTLNMTPNRIFDFCAGPINIDFELSTVRMNSRDWVDILIQPFENNVAAIDTNVNALPERGILVVQEGSFFLNTISGYQMTGHGGSYSPIGTGVLSGVNQAAVRQTFRLVVGRTQASMTRLASPTAPSPFQSFNVTFPDVGFCLGTVSFVHLDYDPAKDTGGSQTGSTWHWGFPGSLSTLWPASTPFTSIKATSRYADAANPNVHFVAPAPTNAFLRFNTAGCGRPDISFNGGTSWVPAVQSDLPKCEINNFFMSIPGGVQDIRVRWTQGGNHIARDFEIWSLNGGAVSTPTPLIPTATATSLPSTSTPVPSTATPVASATSTSTPVPSTATPLPTSTPQPQICQFAVRYGAADNPALGWVDRPLSECAGAHP